MKINWTKKLASRKFWAAVVSFVSNILILVGVADNTVTQVTAIIMAGATVVAYIVAEGLVDTANVATTTTETTNEE